MNENETITTLGKDDLIDLVVNGRDQIASLTAELEALRKDKDRLDWRPGSQKPIKASCDSDYFLCLDLGGNPMVCVYLFDDSQFTLGGGDTQKVLFWFPLRTAIDSAMKEKSV